MLSRKILSWDDFDFSSNTDVAGSGVWYDLLTFEIAQLNIRKFFAGRGFQLKIPTVDQDTGQDIDAADTYTMSLTNSIPDISGPSLDYQVQVFADGTELPVSAIDASADELTVDTSGSSNSDADITAFYISDKSEQFVRMVVQASTNEWDDFLYDDLGGLHSLDQRNTEERSVIENDMTAPEFFYVKVQVKSALTYATNPNQVSSLNNYDIDTDVSQLILPHKMQGIDEYMAKQGTPGTCEAVKEAVILDLSH